MKRQYSNVGTNGGTTYTRGWEGHFGEERTDDLERESIDDARAMPPETKLLIGLELWDQAVMLARAGLRLQMPGADEQAIERSWPACASFVAMTVRSGHRRDATMARRYQRLGLPAFVRAVEE